MLWDEERLWSVRACASDGPGSHWNERGIIMISVRRFLVGVGAGVAVGALALFSNPPQAAEVAYCPDLGCSGPSACRYTANTRCEDYPPPCVFRACELNFGLRLNGGD